MGGSASREFNCKVIACVNSEANLEETLGNPIVIQSTALACERR